MEKLEQQRIPHAGSTQRTIVATLAFLLLMIVGPGAGAQTYKVLHNFTDGSDGGYPDATLTIDRGGNLYGTALLGGRANAGTVFKLTRYGSNYIFNPIYNFQGTYDGNGPWGPVIFGPDGTLYGTTIGGGYSGGDYCRGGCGVVFRLRPPLTTPPSPFTPWSESVLHAFQGPPADGDEPIFGSLTLDAAGNLYGTTSSGGSGSFGTVYKMTPANGGWTESILYNFAYGPDGQQPQAGVVMDQAGNLYSTTVEGGSGGNGVAYELTPTQYGWQETILHAFNSNDGGLIYAGLVSDAAGNLYGAASDSGTGGGTIFELSPGSQGWTFAIIYRLSGGGAGGPHQTLTIDAAGNLYGAAFDDGANGAGMVFKLSQSNGVWSLTDLHDFDFGTAYFPYGGVTLDASGNLYGTTQNGGVYGWGVVWEITP
jgi:uncharacterized repeat protein (TIGR03803 family)